MRTLENVSCSLNLGLIYSLDYSYSPESGATITIFFVNQSGEYSEPSLLPMRKVSITIGPASFSMYPKSYKISKASGRRVISVDFVDETFKLDNFYVTLTGRGSGQNIYQLGSPVDRRTIAEKLQDALDPTAEKIKEFTQFPDLEYSFDDFIRVLRREFSVNVNASYDATITRSSVGTFREVLSDWCSFFNLAFYFENSRINIYDPTRITINLPSKPNDAISYEVSEDIGSTYGKTVVNYFQQEGDEKELSETFDENGGEPSDTNNNNSSGGANSNTIKYLQLWPIGYEFNLQQPTLDLNQVAAAMYGKKFWMLYNIANNKLSECGMTKTNQVYSGNTVSEINEKILEDKFAAYYNYGKNIAGKYYLSYRVDGLTILKDTTWFSEAEGQIFNMDSELAQERAVSPEFLDPPDDDINIISETIINEYFPGVNFRGKRVFYKDTKDYGESDAFALTDAQELSIEKTFNDLFPEGNKSVDYSSLDGLSGNKNYISYSPNFTIDNGVVPNDIQSLIDEINKGNKQVYLKPRYASYDLKGLRTRDIINQKDLENQPSEIKPKTNSGPTVVANTSTVKVKKEGSYVVYYDKYSTSASASTLSNYFGHKFDIKRVSTDNYIGLNFQKIGNTYSIQRNVAFIDSLVKNPFLPQLAQGRTFPTKTVSFSLNYFYSIPSNFLSNGLVGMQMSVSDNGVSATYTFSNSPLEVPNKINDFEKFEQNIKNSWIRQYRPKEVIS